MTRKASEIFAERARERLDALDWTHENLAAKLEIERGTVSKYLQGKTAPGADLVLSWADALETSPNFLLGFSSEEHKEDPRLRAIRSILLANAGEMDGILCACLTIEKRLGTSKKEEASG